MRVGDRQELYRRTHGRFRVGLNNRFSHNRFSRSGLN